MATFKTLEIAGWMPAIKGMRHPLKSYDRSDTDFLEQNNDDFAIGKNDYGLAMRLCNAGPEHAKWMRQIQVWVEISAPRYYWSEFDTYKIGTAANSQSTMHKLKDEPLTKDCFEFEWGQDAVADKLMEVLMEELKSLQKKMNNDMDAETRNMYHRLMKGLLPESFIQTRMVSLNYQVLQNMYHQRKDHRLPQWNTDFVNWVKTLPYSEFITGRDLIDKK